MRGTQATDWLCFERFLCRKSPALRLGRMILVSDHSSPGVSARYLANDSRMACISLPVYKVFPASCLAPPEAAQSASIPYHNEGPSLL